MKKSIVRCLLSLFASALFVSSASAEKSATFNLTTPRYYVDGNVVWGNPDFVRGQRGLFTSFESLPSSSSYSCNAESGYYATGWTLVTAGLSGTTVASWGSQNSITVTFDYNWAEEYGTALELVPSIAQMSYTLEYDANGGDWTAGVPEGGTYKYNQSVTAPSEDSVEKANYVLSGWKASGGSLIDPSEEFGGSALGIAKNNQSVTLYAQWSAVTYKVSLETNGGTVSKDLTSYTYGKGATLPTAKKTGSTFEGWYEDPLFNGSAVTKISTTDSGDKTFYAKFSSDIHYDGNGATSGTMSDTPFVADKSVQLAKNAFSRVFTVTYDANGGKVDIASEKVEYVFKNWNSQPDGLGSYTYGDSQDVTNPCGATGGAVTLYAQWQPESATVTLPAATKSGDLFAGWFTSGGIRVGGAGDAYAPAWNVKLYARWNAVKTKSYAAKFSPGAEVANPNAMEDVVAASGQSITLPTCKYSTPLAYKKFLLWERNGVTYEVGDSFTYDAVNDGDEVLFRAVWETSDLSEAVGLEGVALLTNNASPGEWKIEEDGTGVKCAINAGMMSMAVNGAGTLRFTRKGGGCLLFVDGSQQGIPNSDSYAEVSYDISGSGVHNIKWRRTNTTEYHISNISWTPTSLSKYAVSASVNPSAGGMASGGGTKKVGETVTLTATANSDYAFVCWSDGNASASRDVTITCKENYQAIFSGGGEVGDSCYYVLFDGNGAGNMSAMDGQKIAAGKATALTANKFARTGHTFKCWGTTRSGGTTTYADKQAVTDLAGEDKTITLYAIWEANESPEPGPEPTPPGPTPEPGVYVSRVGESVAVDLLSDYPNLKSVSGLPSGLKYNAKTGYVTGTPTKAVSKTENVKLTFKDKTTEKITWTVEALPTTMVGTYYGRAEIEDGSVGQFQLKLTAAGKVSGYFYAAGKKVSFKSTALVYEDEDSYVATVAYTYNRTKYADTIRLAYGATVEGVKGDVDLWYASVGESDVLYAVEAGRDTIKEVFGKVKAEKIDVLEKTEDGEYLKATVSTAGAVKVSGKLLSDAGKLVLVSCSTHLLVSEEGGTYFYVTIYKTVSKSEPIVFDEIVE